MARKPVPDDLKRKKVQAYLRPEDYDWMQEAVGDEPGKRWQSPSEMWDVGMRLLKLYHERAESFEAGMVEEAVRQAHR